MIIVLMMSTYLQGQASQPKKTCREDSIEENVTTCICLFGHVLVSTSILMNCQGILSCELLMQYFQYTGFSPILLWSFSFLQLLMVFIKFSFCF